MVLNVYSAVKSTYVKIAYTSTKVNRHNRLQTFVIANLLRQFCNLLFNIQQFLLLLGQ